MTTNKSDLLSAMCLLNYDRSRYWKYRTPLKTDKGQDQRKLAVG